MDDNELSLKELLLSVSLKLDRFIETHSLLHVEQARREAKVDQILLTQATWGKELTDLKEWKTEVNGQLKLIKWMAGGGLVGAATTVARLLGMPLP